MKPNPDAEFILPDGRKLEKPGNLFHSLLEPAVWGTLPEFTGLAVDLNGMVGRFRL